LGNSRKALKYIREDDALIPTTNRKFTHFLQDILDLHVLIRSRENGIRWPEEQYLSIKLSGSIVVSDIVGEIPMGDHQPD